MDPDGSPKRVIWCTTHGVPLLTDCIALNVCKEVRTHEQKRKSPFGASGGTAGCPS